MMISASLDKSSLYPIAIENPQLFRKLRSNILSPTAIHSFREIPNLDM